MLQLYHMSRVTYRSSYRPRVTVLAPLSVPHAAAAAAAGVAVAAGHVVHGAAAAAADAGGVAGGGLGLHVPPGRRQSLFAKALNPRNDHF